MPIIVGFNPNDIEKNKIQRIGEKIDKEIESDPFLKDKVDSKKLVKIFIKNPKSEYSVRSFASARSDKIIMNIPFIDRPITVTNAFSDYRLLTQLYRIPGERKAILKRPYINRKLKNWYYKLKDEFFPLYFQYETNFIHIGVSKGVMLNHRDIADEHYDICSHLIQADILERILHFPKDYLFHYLLGVQIIWPAFLLANQREKSEKLRTQLEEVYKLSNPRVIESTFSHGSLVAESDPFDDYFYPSLSGEVNYMTMANKFLEDSVEIRKLSYPYMSQVRFNPKYKRAKKYFLDCLKRRNYVS